MANNISYTYTLIDKFTETAQQIRGSLDKVSKKMSEISKKSEKLGKSFTKVGKSLSLKLTAPLVAGATLATVKFAEQEDSLAALSASYAIHGKRIGLTLDQIVAKANQVQDSTKTSSEEYITSVLIPLMQMGNLTGDAFIRAGDQMLEIAQKNNRAVNTVVQNVGGAINNLSGGIATLEMRGAQFTDTEKEMIKELANQGRAADVVSIKLQALERSYIGAAEAAGDTFSGQVKKARNEIDEVWASIGKIISESLLPFSIWLRESAIKMNIFVKENKSFVKVLLALGAALAVIAPLLLTIGLGIKLVGIAFAGAGLIVAAGPILAIAAAFVAAIAVIWKFRDSIIHIGTLFAGFIKKTILAPVELAQAALEKLSAVADKVSGTVSSVTGFVSNARSSAKSRNLSQLQRFTAAPADAGNNISLGSGGVPIIGGAANGKVEVTVNLRDNSGVVESVTGQSYGNTELDTGTNMEMGY